MIHLALLVSCDSVLGWAALMVQGLSRMYLAKVKDADVWLLDVTVLGVLILLVFLL